jgi:hypothetical protein
MLRRPLIRHTIGLGLALLFGGGLALGCGAALAAIPDLLNAVTPAISWPGPSAPGIVRLPIPDGFAESRFKPQLLYPVAARPRPDWLVEAMRVAKVGEPPRLRGSQPVIAICIDDLGVDLAGTEGDGVAQAGGAVFPALCGQHAFPGGSSGARRPSGAGACADAGLERV